MELTNPLKMLPSQYYLPLAIVAGGLLAWRFMFSGSGGDESATNPSMGYDPALVALGVQTSLERDKLNAQTELGKLAMSTELQALDKQYANDGLLMSFADKANDRAFQAEVHGINSNERISGAAISAERDSAYWTNETEKHVANQTAWSSVETARVIGDAQVKTAKASKKKSIGFKGFSLSF